MNIPLQSHFLYNGKWCADIDKVLVDTITKLKGDTGWAEHEFPSYFLLTAASEIEAKLAVHFSESELAIRMRLLALRYQTFKEVVRTKGTFWDMPFKCVIAADCVWKKILKNNAFAAAYYYHDEPEYSKLACLFGLDDVKVEGAKEVIVISESTEENSSDESSDYATDADTDEVNSPVVIPKPPVRRKLFFNDDVATDMESTTDAGIYFIVAGHDGNLSTRFEMSRPLLKNPFVKKYEALVRRTRLSGGGLIFSSELRSWNDGGGCKSDKHMQYIYNAQGHTLHGLCSFVFQTSPPSFGYRVYYGFVFPVWANVACVVLPPFRGN
ncbi:hypothetical protein AAHA92_22598 [Salvia divinorum]|uniref:Myb/SANT-like domain-containing protein n=1 Tax=Salvia divinorum TaxID=28513 RepID=A0ABD1GQC5_SALDI